MKKDDVKWKGVPKKPGIYFFIGPRREILYIGKATSLHSRVKSYFGEGIKEKRSALIERMVHEAVKVEWTVVDSILEALLLETNLIRTHKPRYNTISKDDKSYNHLVITNEEFPRVCVVRGKDIATVENGDTPYAHVYGPFPNGTLFKEALKIVRKLFRFYDGEVTHRAAVSKVHKGKIDFNRQIGLYPENCTKREYAQTIRHVRLFFEGKKQLILKDLEKRMSTHARHEEFEEAEKVKRKIFALKHIEDVALIKDETRTYADERTFRIEAYDVAHMGGAHMVGVMTVVEGGVARPSEYRKFIIRSCDDAHDTRALKEIVERRLAHPEWSYPALIVADGSTAQVRTIEKVLTERERVIPVVGVVKDEHHRPARIIGSKKLITKYKQDIVLANAEAHRFAITFHRSKRRVV